MPCIHFTSFPSATLELKSSEPSKENQLPWLPLKHVCPNDYQYLMSTSRARVPAFCHGFSRSKVINNSPVGGGNGDNQTSLRVQGKGRPLKAKKRDTIFPFGTTLPTRLKNQGKKSQESRFLPAKVAAAAKEIMNPDSEEEENGELSYHHYSVQWRRRRRRKKWKNLFVSIMNPCVCLERIIFLCSGNALHKNLCFRISQSFSRRHPTNQPKLKHNKFE